MKSFGSLIRDLFSTIGGPALPSTSTEMTLHDALRLCGSQDANCTIHATLKDGKSLQVKTCDHANPNKVRRTSGREGSRALRAANDPPALR
jgi:hypothetical protein